MEKMNPNLLRKEIMKKRQQVPEIERQSIFNQILAQFVSLPEYTSAKHILAYFGKTSSGEFDTRSLLTQIQADHKRLYLPRCMEKEIGLEIYEIKDIMRDLVTGRFGLMEPIPSRSSMVSFEEIDLVIVPGLVFDKDGTRYGYGKGYYDRFLIQNSRGNLDHPLKVAFAFDFSVVAFSLLRTEFDVPMELIITEKRILRCT